MQLAVPRINSSQFDHYPRSKRLVAEVSCTGLHRFERLYDDACDVGFALVNKDTGNATRWALSQEVRCGTIDNEVVGWKFVPAPESVRKNPVLEGYTLMLLND